MGPMGQLYLIGPIGLMSQMGQMGLMSQMSPMSQMGLMGQMSPIGQVYAHRCFSEEAKGDRGWCTGHETGGRPLRLRTSD